VRLRRDLCCVCELLGAVAATDTVARAGPPEHCRSDWRERNEREGTALGQAHVREVQSHPPSGAGARDLLKSPSQAAAGL